MIRAVALVALVACAACSSAASQPTPFARKLSTTELLGSMATLAGMIPDAAFIADWAKRIDSQQAKTTDFIDAILKNERFASEVIPSLVFGSYVNVRNYYALPSSFVLKQTPGTDEPFYLRQPCSAAEGVTVRPWWALSTEVKVCPDAYRPEKWTMSADEHSYKTRTTLACDSQIGSPEAESSPLCGCGPNLIRCMRNEDQYQEINASLMNEIKRTTAYIVQNDLPMASLFTGNSTWRDRNVEYYYRRQKIGALELAPVEKELAPLEQWPDGGKWAPREELRPGQHAGVLTAPQVLHWLPDRRQRQRGYYEILWCNLRNSFGATTHKVLEINSSGNNFFAHDSWNKLAHTELCTSCHARLDYGFQFFLGYLDSRASTHYHPTLHQTTNGPLYGEDIDDPRGEAPLTPLGFAKLATAQPDFKSCMASHFASYVLGDYASPDDVRAIEAVVTGEAAFKPGMKVALERYAAKWSASPSPAATPAKPAGGQAGPKGGILVTAALREHLDNYCVDCHDKAPYTDAADAPDVAFDFRGSELPRALLVSMTDQVAFGMMPKSATLDVHVRENIVRVLLDTLWTDPKARAEAERYFLGGARGLPAQQLDNALHAIGALAGARSDVAWGALERGIWIDQATLSPGFLAITGLDAMRACAKSGAKGQALEDCIAKATSLKVLSRSPIQTR